MSDDEKGDAAVYAHLRNKIVFQQYSRSTYGGCGEGVARTEACHRGKDFYEETTSRDP